MRADVGDIIESLWLDHGIMAVQAHSPSLLMIPIMEGDILLTQGHNHDGWEAAVDLLPSMEQHPLLDGPGEHADPRAVADWAVGLIKNLKASFA